MTKHLLFALLAASACGTVSTPSDPAGDDGGDDVEDPPIDPGKLSIVPARWHDERLDTIDFTSGEPVHTHDVASVRVSSDGECPEVARYAYLLDRMPTFGRQTTPNAIDLEVAVPTIPLDPTASAYRLTTGDGEELIPWTPLGPVSDGRAHVGIYRDEAPRLGAYAGELHVEVRVRTTAGVEQTASACWTHRPLTAPLRVEPLQAALGPTSMVARSLAAPESSPLDVLKPVSSALPAMYSARITQQTAEPITIGFTVAPPAGTFTSKLAYAYFPTATVAAPGSCEDFPDSCDTSAVPATTFTTASGALTTGTFHWSIFDEATGERMPCSLTTCEIPARGADAEPRTYRLNIEGTDFSNLWHEAGTFSAVREVTLPSATVIGAYSTQNKVQRCTRLRTIQGVTVCVTLTEYSRLTALDAATLQLPPLAVQVSTGSGTIPSAPVPYLTGGALTTPAFSWDGGGGPF